MQNKVRKNGKRYAKHGQQEGRYNIIRILFLLIAICYVLFLVEEKIRPVLRAVMEYESREYAITAFNEAVQTHLAENPDAYSNLYEVTWDADGVPTAVVANSYEINMVRSALAQEVTTVLNEKSENVYSIQLGRLSGIQMLAARGPAIPLNINPQSYVIATIYSTIETAGENQTLLSVYGRFTVQINITMAGYLQTITIENDVLLWQNLLLGRVPDVNV